MLNGLRFSMNFLPLRITNKYDETKIIIDIGLLMNGKWFSRSSDNKGKFKISKNEKKNRNEFRIKKKLPC